MTNSTRRQASEETTDLRDPFEITSLSKADPPEGAEGTNWYQYVIRQGPNKIVGYRRGSLRAVRRDIDEIVVNLNERRRGKVGRVHLTPSRRKRK